MPNRAINNIQMLRGIASILVVFHHILPHYLAMGGDLKMIKYISTWGFLGVDIFFVISGYIMAYTTFNKPRNLESAKIFIKHRLFRIYLAYWIFWIMAFIILYITNHLKIENTHLLLSFFLLDVDMDNLVLPISWSLSYELYFYFLFLFTFLFSTKILTKIIPMLFLVILSLVLISSFTNGLNSSFFYSHFILEFFGGVILYLYRDYIIRLWLAPFIIFLSIISYYYGIENEYRNGIYRVLTFGIGALALVWFFLILERDNIYKAKGYLTLLGDASYTIYLSHLVIIWLFYFSGVIDFFTKIKEPNLASIVLLSTITIFSTLYYLKVEKPIYKKAISI